jgi:hypothetical protein
MRKRRTTGGASYHVVRSGRGRGAPGVEHTVDVMAWSSGVPHGLIVGWRRLPSHTSGDAVAPAPFSGCFENAPKYRLESGA